MKQAKRKQCWTGKGHHNWSCSGVAGGLLAACCCRCCGRLLRLQAPTLGAMLSPVRAAARLAAVAHAAAAAAEAQAAGDAAPGRGADAGRARRLHSLGRCGCGSSMTLCFSASLHWRLQPGHGKPLRSNHSCAPLGTAIGLSTQQSSSICPNRQAAVVQARHGSFNGARRSSGRAVFGALQQQAVGCRCCCRLGCRVVAAQVLHQGCDLSGKPTRELIAAMLALQRRRPGLDVQPCDALVSGP